jgi:hypothetical protein
VGEENVKKIRRKDVFGGIFTSTVSLSISGWLGNPMGIPMMTSLDRALHCEDDPICNTRTIHHCSLYTCMLYTRTGTLVGKTGNIVGGIITMKQ